MKQIKNWFFTDIVFFLIFSSLFIILGFLPTILQARHAAAGSLFPLIHNNPLDFYFYLSLMNQGAHGAWLVSDPYTLEATNPSFIGSFFVLMGKLGSIVNLPNYLTYNLVRLFAAFSLMAAVFAFFSTVFDARDRKIAFWFYLIAGSWLKFNQLNAGWNKAVFMNWWTGIDATRRHVFLPHHLLANALLVWSYTIIIRYSKNPTQKRILFILILLTIAAFIHTPSTFTFFVSALPAMVLLFVLKVIKNGKTVIGLAIATGLLFIPLLLVQRQVTLGFPWNQLTAWETTLNYPVKEELFGALGILFPFALLALVSIVRKPQLEGTLMAAWLFVPLILLPFATKLTLNPIRLTQGALFVPLAGLAVIGLRSLSHTGRIRRISLIGLISLISLPTIIYSFRSHTEELWTQASNIYLSASDVLTLGKLSQIAPQRSKVAASFYTANTTPAFAYVTMFLGSSTYTINPAKKEAEMTSLLKGQMTNDQAKKWLSQNDIHYIITLNHDNWLYGWPGNRYPDVLTTRFEQGTNGVYEVKKVQ